MVRVAITLLVMISVLLISAGPAAAGPVRKDGKIRACYRVKGKPKGALRLLVKGKRCRRGERVVVWTAIASAGGSGPTAGEPGKTGQPGSPGASGSADVASLTAQIDALTKRVESLEAILKGITNADLVGLLDVVPAVGALCEQASGMTGAFNALTAGIEGIAIIGDPLLGLDFDTLPASLAPFSCP
jgi:hypothetical protein